MKRISIFVAGAKNLDEQRKSIKALANDMTTEYARMKQDICVNISSYDNLSTILQDDFDDFISNDADIVLFVLDGCIGEKTEQEYVHAMKCRQERGYPYIYVFFRRGEVKSPEEAYVDGLFKGLTKEYYINYVNDFDLVLKVKGVLRRTIYDICAAQASSKRGALVATLRRVRWVTMVLLVLLAACGMMLYLLLSRPANDARVGHERELLIIGGGSAERYIAHEYGVDVKALPNADYLPLPSGVAWPILVEEAQGNDKRYFTVAISADSANMYDIGLRSGDDCIVSVPLGLDTLVVYAKDDALVRRHFSRENLEEQRISVDELREFMEHNDSIRVFSTSTSSGTRNAYEKILGSENLSPEKCAHFMKISHSDEPYIILASRHYMDNVGAMPMSVYRREADGSEIYCSKPMFLYFIAYSKHAKLDSRGGDMEYVVPEGTVELLRRLDVDVDAKIRDNRVMVRGDKCYLDFSELSSW